MTLTVFVALLTAPVLALAAEASSNFTLASKTFAEGATLPASAVANVYGCTGPNQSPELHWSGAPAGASSFALIMRDPDAPVAGGFWHWIAFNIPAQTSDLAAGGSWPKGSVSGTNSTGASGYLGPCPPAGKPHHYVFTLYALDVKTVSGADGSTTGPQLLAAMKGHILGQATLTGLYGR